MRQITFPTAGQRVDIYTQFDGDDQISGPFEAWVLDIDPDNREVPELDVVVKFSEDGGLQHLSRVQYGAGHKTYWLPRP